MRHNTTGLKAYAPEKQWKRWKQWLSLGIVFSLMLVVGILLGNFVLTTSPMMSLYEGQHVAQTIAQTAWQSSVVQVSSGIYVPRRGMILYSQVRYDDEQQVRDWAAQQLVVVATELAKFPRDETLFWFIDYGLATTRQKTILAPLSVAANPAHHRYVVNHIAGLKDDIPISAQQVLPNTQQTPSPINQVMTQTALITPTFSATPIASTPNPATPAIQPVIPTVEVAQPTVESPTPSVPTVIPNTPTSTPTLVPPTVYEQDFSVDSTAWQVLSGEWQINDGVYSQKRDIGANLTTIFKQPILSDYELTVRFRHQQGDLGVGLLYNIPNPETRSRAQVIDVTNAGTYLRWGYYAATDEYIFQGGRPLANHLADGNWHTLKIAVTGTTGILYLNGDTITQLDHQSISGYLGLFTTQAAVDFDDVKLVVHN